MKNRFHFVLLLLVLSTSSLSLAITPAQLKGKIQAINLSANARGENPKKLHTRYDKLDPTRSKDRTAYVDLAYEYLKIHYVQEAIWALNKADEKELALLLQKKLIHFLQSTWAKNKTPTGRRSSVFTFPGGIEAIFKTNGMYDNPAAELYTYELSNALGLDIVPLTIEYEVDNDRGSLQVMVNDFQWGKMDLKTAKYTDELAELQVLDYLIWNKDRNQTNWIIRGDAIVAIDHGLAYSHPPSQDWESYPDPIPLLKPNFSILKNSVALEKLTALSDANLKKALAKSVPDKVIQFYLKQRRELLKLVGVTKSSLKAKRCSRSLKAA